METEVKRYVLINQDGLVVNLIGWDGVTHFIAPNNTVAIQSETAQRNDIFDGEKFNKPQITEETGE